MASITTLILIRHGETEWNRERRIQGQLDSVLTPEGVAQAEACAKRLAEEQIDAVFASDLGRVRHTARLLLNGRTLPTTFDADLRERCFGTGQGMTYAEMDAKYPQIFAQTGLVDSEFTLPEGETRAVFHARVNNAIRRLAAAHEGKRLLVVTHGGVLGAIYRALNDLPVASSVRVAIPNVGYNRISIDQNRWRIDAWADTSHLAVETLGGV
ncbi:MAG: histidine phosphatase family protein [Usitatibacteraceae bacterium]